MGLKGGMKGTKITSKYVRSVTGQHAEEIGREELLLEIYWQYIGVMLCHIETPYCVYENKA